MEEDDVVGYGRPPKKAQFRKGKSGNPAGRPSKAKISAERSDADILRAIGNQTVEVNGRKITKRELLFEAAFTRAIKGDSSAFRILTIMFEKAEKARIATRDKPRTGVLVVPGTMPSAEWSAAAALQQAKYRESNYGKEEF